mgnify:CR=1 FL=1
MEGTWKNITNGTQGTFSIFDNPDMNVGCCSSGGDDKDALRKKSIDKKNSNFKSLTLTVERSALLNFYSGSNGRTWNVSTNWGSDKPVSEWYGIETHKTTGLVKSIRLV